jgi:hypothetical protein
MKMVPVTGASLQSLANPFEKYPEEALANTAERNCISRTFWEQFEEDTNVALNLISKAFSIN